MQTLASASNQALKTIAKTKFERVIFTMRHYHKVMSAKYGDAFNPHGDDTILSAINDMSSFLDTVEKNKSYPRKLATNTTTSSSWHTARASND